MMEDDEFDELTVGSYISWIEGEHEMSPQKFRQLSETMSIQNLDQPYRNNSSIICIAPNKFGLMKTETIENKTFLTISYQDKATARIDCSIWKDIYQPLVLYNHPNNLLLLVKYISNGNLSIHTVNCAEQKLVSTYSGKIDGHSICSIHYQDKESFYFHSHNQIYRFEYKTEEIKPLPLQVYANYFGPVMYKNHVYHLDKGQFICKWSMSSQSEIIRHDISKNAKNQLVKQIGRAHV